MALNLSTLTSSATSGDVLAEALTTADFLEPVPVLRNLARGSQKGGDAKQDVALNQPKALPLDANGKGYLYLSGVTGNYASVPHAANLNGITDFVMEARDVYMSDWATGSETFFAKYGNTTKTFTFRRSGANINFYSEGHNHFNFTHGLTGAATASIRLTRAGTSVTAELDTGSGYAAIGSALTINTAQLLDVTDPVEIGARQEGTNQLLTGKIGQIRLWKNATSSGTPVLDVDFTATTVRHGDTKFKCATGQVVTINQSGNDPATIIKKPVLRFDGTNDGLRGVFANNINGGYMFAAFSVLGDGGSSYARVFSVNANGSSDSNTNGFLYGFKYASTNELAAFGANADLWSHTDMYDDERGDILYEAKAKSGGLISKVNNANKFQLSTTLAIASNEFNVGNSIASLSKPAAIDLEYLALFPATITDAQADDVRNYINNRNNVFDLKDGFGYYFYDAQKAPVGAISSGSSAWNGRIVGSDNGDTDKLATQSTANHQPVGDGFKVTFADNTDHLDIPSTSQAGWQIVGTSLGTFAYRVNANAQVRLNLLGYRGSASYRFAGDLYGIILLPESATGKDIEEARKLLIDRGAADGTSTGDYLAAWYLRNDIVEFKNVNMDSVTRPESAWQDAASLESFDIQLPSATNATASWLRCTSLSDFRTTDLKNCSNFLATWKDCTALTSFPAGAKLGTEASSVNFTSAWQSSGLTSFPALDLSNGTNFSNSFTSSALTSFSAGIKMGTAASGDVQFNDTWRDTTLSSFPGLDLGNGKFFNGAWRDCHELTSFPSDIKLGTNKTGVGFTDAWRGSGLTSFPALDLSTGTNFNQAFYQATSLQEFGQCDFSNGSSFDLSWYYCSALTTFPSMQLPSATSLNSTWMGCNSLTNFGKLEAPNVTVFRFTWSGSGITTIEDGTLLGTSASSVDFTSAFKNCTALTTLPSNLNLSKGDDFQTAFQNCQSLVDFPANAFDTMGTPQDYCFLNTWLDNNALSAASVENILVSINTSGQSAPSTGPEITIKYNTATGTPAYSTLASLKGKGWVVIVNGVTL